MITSVPHHAKEASVARKAQIHYAYEMFYTLKVLVILGQDYGPGEKLPVYALLKLPTKCIANGKPLGDHIGDA